MSWLNRRKQIDDAVNAAVNGRGMPKPKKGKGKKGRDQKTRDQKKQDRK